MVINLTGNEENGNDKVMTLSPDAEQILKQQAIDEDRPGTLLRDFQTLLDFIGTEGSQVSGKFDLLPVTSVQELNKQMSHPIAVNLKRPVHKSYPYVQALYLLLRSSGFAKIEGKGKNRKIYLDERVLRSWSNLNPTERYFNLFVNWIIFGDSQIIGEYSGLGGGDITSCALFWNLLPAEGKKIPRNQQDAKTEFRMPKLYNLALLHLLGFLDLKHGEPKPNQGWQVAEVRPTPFGNVMIETFRNHIVLHPDFYVFEPDGLYCADENQQDEKEVLAKSFNLLQSIFQPYFPAWKQNLEERQPEFTKGIYVFKVSLGKVWRRMALRSDENLQSLSHFILDAFDFAYDHLYCFEYRSYRGPLESVYHTSMDRWPHVDRVAIGNLPLEEGQTMLFLFDFGDNWKFDVLLERIEPMNETRQEPELLEVHGKAPEQYPNWDEEEEDEG